mmetsp:Transcript_6422/g.19421  ORF Transcript_6422/g.19421 Transcript_6422/m.19421 type:complete len:259 (-) Transcript_6422:722-1498(-)
MSAGSTQELRPTDVEVPRMTSITQDLTNASKGPVSQSLRADAPSSAVALRAAARGTAPGCGAGLASGLPLESEPAASLHTDRPASTTEASPAATPPARPSSSRNRTRRRPRSSGSDASSSAAGPAAPDPPCCGRGGGPESDTTAARLPCPERKDSISVRTERSSSRKSSCCFCFASSALHTERVRRISSCKSCPPCRPAADASSPPWIVQARALQCLPATSLGGVTSHWPGSSQSDLFGLQTSLQLSSSSSSTVGRNR